MTSGLPHKSTAEQSVVAGPTVVMRVTDRDGRDISTAKVGDDADNVESYLRLLSIMLGWRRSGPQI